MISPQAPPERTKAQDHQHEKQGFWGMERRGGICDLVGRPRRLEPMGGRNTMGRGRWDLKHGALALVWALTRRRVPLTRDLRRVVW